MAAVSPRSGAISTTQPLAPIPSGPASADKGGLGLDECRKVGQELNHWFSRELTTAASLESRQRSNYVRHEVLKAVLEGRKDVSSGYHDVSGELSTMLGAHGVTFKGSDGTGQSPPAVTGQSDLAAIEKSCDVSHVMDVWVDEAADAPQMVERSGVRLKILDAILARAEEVQVDYEGAPIPDLQRFGIRVASPPAGSAASHVDSAADIGTAIEKLTADLSTEGSRLRFRHQGAALLQRIEQLGGDTAPLKARLRTKINELTKVPPSQWFLTEVSALRVNLARQAGSTDDFVKGVHVKLATSGRMISASSMSLAEKFSSYNALLNQAQEVAESLQSPGFHADLQAAISKTFKEIETGVGAIRVTRGTAEALAKQQYLDSLTARLEEIDALVGAGPDG